MGTELSIFEDWSERSLGKLRVGVIGTGMAFERLHYPAYLKLSDVYEIGAVCDQDESKLADWVKGWDWAAKTSTPTGARWWAGTILMLSTLWSPLS